MPEIKHQFSKGKMNKDLDERLVPNGEYRDAMNIQVLSSEGSDVGTAQNILGNAKIPFTFEKDGNTITYEFPDDSIVVGAISDEKNDTLYWFVHSSTADYILSIDKIRMQFVFIDTFVNSAKAVLKFAALGHRKITGINIIDGMIFWTDNETEPKKININRSIFGTPLPSTAGVVSNTLLVIDENPPLENYVLAVDSAGSNIDVEEKHITVIKKTPSRSPKLRLESFRQPDLIYTGIVYVQNDLGQLNESSFWYPGAPANQQDIYNFLAIDVTDETKNELWMQITEGVDNSGTIINLPLGTSSLTGWMNPSTSLSGMVGKTVVFRAFTNPLDWDDVPGLPVTDWTLKGNIVGVGGSSNIKVKFTSQEGTPELPDASTIPPQTELKFVVDLFDEKEKLFEFKFPRFSYRYKYEDGEYSPFAPFTEVAFYPGSFDYHPRKGYNLGMTNRLKAIYLSEFVNENTDKDVVSIDILFKDDASPVVYVLDTITPFDESDSTGLNYWQTILNGGSYPITAETVNNTVESNQLLRPWDNVPRRALAQDITGNRIVYGNYVQNYNLHTISTGKKYLADFDNEWVNFPLSATDTSKSCKTLREYQLGVVFLDEYGRETPVISNRTGTMKLEKQMAAMQNRIKAKLTGSQFPSSATYMKFFIKETANEYYNMAMDRWYYAEDGNIWLSFPSSDRNKVDIDTFLILKKGSDSDDLVTDAARYKILAIEAEAPDFIKYKYTVGSRVVHTFATATVTGNEIWEANVLDGIPLEGSDELLLNYNPYKDNPGKNLHNFDGVLYIEFGLLGEEETSAKYRINNISCSADPSGTVQTTDAFFIQLDEPMGDDVNFLTNGGGTAATGVKNNIIINIYKYEKRSTPQFDGRFFVKIYFDDVFRKNIETIYANGAKYRIVDQRRIWYKTHNWVDQLTSRMSWWFTPGRWAPHPTNTYDQITGYNNAYGTKGFWEEQANDGYEAGSRLANYNWKEVENDMQNYTTTNIFNLKWFGHIDSSQGPFARWNHHPFYDYGTTQSSAGTRQNEPVRHYGFYENDKFAAANLYFRKYVWNNESGKINGFSNGSQSKNSDNYYYQHNAPWCLAWYQSGDRNDPDSYRGVPADASWRRRSGVCEGPRSDDRILLGYKEPDDDAGYDYNRDSWRHCEVWFIDNGKKQGRRAGQQSAFFPHDESGADQYANQPNNSSMGGAKPTGLDIISNANWAMDLNFGGITGASMESYDQGTAVNSYHWDIGFWNQDVDTNPYYGDVATEKWVNKINPGNSFRWKQDPTKTIYNMPSQITEKQWVVHSTYGVENDAQVGALFGSSGEGMAQRMYSGHAHNCVKGWRVNWIGPGLAWDPTNGGQLGKITNGTDINLIACNADGDSSAGGSQLSITIGNNSKAGSFMYVFVKDIVPGLDSSGDPERNDGYYEQGNPGLHVGMALYQWQRQDTGAYLKVKDVSNGGNGFQEDYQDGFSRGNDYFVVTEIIEMESSSGEVFYALKLAGYNFPLQNDDHRWLAPGDEGFSQPKIGGYYNFVQVAMNGHNENTQFNINLLGYQLNGKHAFNSSNFGPVTQSYPKGPFYWTTDGIGAIGDKQEMGKIGAVGYDMQFVDEIRPLEVMSENPAIWETEPKESKDLDIYYEASAAIPIIADSERIHEAIPIGSRIYLPDTLTLNFAQGQDTVGFLVEGYNGSNLIVSLPGIGYVPAGNTFINSSGNPALPGQLHVVRPDGLRIGIHVTNVIAGTPNGEMIFHPLMYNANYYLTWHNCFSFGNGVESNRIRDNFNLPFISNGVKASTTLDEEYQEEHRKYGLIYSGIYNSNSGVNNLNQFIQAEKITKDINPIYGSVQKLHARDTDLVTLCEDKILRILSNKDAVFNADGNTNLTATDKVLGQTIPFSGEFGISTNPESFASEAYRSYFTDRIRGVVLRLSKDGLTPISDYGMRDWFKDNLKLTVQAVGSYDDRNDEYNLHLKMINKDLWNTSSPDYNPNIGDDLVESMRFNNRISKTTPLNIKYILENNAGSIDEEINNRYLDAKIITYSEKVKGWVSFKSFVKMQMAISMGNDYFSFHKGNIYVHYIEQNLVPWASLSNVVVEPRNTFYEEYTESSIDVMLNDNPGAIKVYNTLNYEGSQAKIDKFTVQTVLSDGFQPDTTYNDQEYYNLYGKPGWYVKDIITNEEQGDLPEFVEKEGKWFNNINRITDINLDEADTSDFTFQGVGIANNNTVTADPDILGCTDPTATNYNSAATIDDGSCVYPPPPPPPPNGGSPSGGFVIPGCMDPNALNYDPNANFDDGSCTYSPLTILGCTDPQATNYDPNANTDDGSCTYNYGCTDPAATNYDATATVDDGSCVYAVDDGGSQGEEPIDDFDTGSGDDPIIFGCTDPAATNYDPTATNDDGSCVYIAPETPGCTDPLASNYDPNATIDDGSCIYEVVYGCTNPAAVNYNPNATVDDGSCEFHRDDDDNGELGEKWGCTDPTALNYNPTSTLDDGSCIYRIEDLDKDPKGTSDTKGDDVIQVQGLEIEPVKETPVEEAPAEEVEVSKYKESDADIEAAEKKAAKEEAAAAEADVDYDADIVEDAYDDGSVPDS